MSRMIWMAAATALTACGGKHPGTYETAAADPAGGSGADAQLAKADALWEQRVDEGKLKAAIDGYQAAHDADPTNRHALVRLTRGWYFWGDAFTDDNDVKVDRWGTAIEFGAKCISLNSKVAGAIAGGSKEKDAVGLATADDVPCLYWTASALGKWGKAQGLSKTLRHLPTVKAYIAKVEELDPTFYNYGPARYWAAYYAALPSFAGQDLDKSGEYFEASIVGAPYYLPTRVLRAEYWAVATQNVKTFDHDLKTVIESDPASKSDAAITPENIKDQEKAAQLLAKRAELFDNKVLAAAGAAPEVSPYVASTATRPDSDTEGAAAERPEDTTEGAAAERPDDTTQGAAAERPDDTTQGAAAERPDTDAESTEGAAATRPDDGDK